MTNPKIQWEKYPEVKPTLGFGLYPVMLKGGCRDDVIGHQYGMLYYYPENKYGYRWQEDMVCYDDEVDMFIDLCVYPEIAYRFFEEK